MDTNVLARLIVEDDVEQLQAARNFFSQRTPTDPAFVSTIVIAELVWLLHDAYGYSHREIVSAMESLMATDDFRVECASYLAEGIALARENRIDIADYLIARVATGEGCNSTVTFDRNASRRIPGMALLK